jgi:hypothetical protein
MLVAGVWVAAGGRGDEFDRQEELWGGLFFAAMGLMCAFVGWSNSRTRRHPRLRGCALTVDRELVRRGDELVVTFEASRDAATPVELGLVCDERYDVEVRTGTTVVRQTHEATAHAEWQPVGRSARTSGATFRVPATAPYSYEGDCVSYAWRVTARGVRRGRRDARLDRPLWVDP